MPVTVVKAKTMTTTTPTTATRACTGSRRPRRLLLHSVLSLLIAGTAAAASPEPVAPFVAPAVAPFVQAAIERALVVPGARLDEAAVETPGARAATCRAEQAEVPRPLDGSGRIAVKLSGRGARGERCEAWTWVRVRVVAPVAVTLRPVRPGEPLAGAFTVGERELRAGHAPATAPLADGAVAARALGAGQVIERDQVSAPAIRLGESLRVVVVAGSLTIEQPGRAVPCARGRTCAVLPSGKHVEGDLVDGRLVVRSP